MAESYTATKHPDEYRKDYAGAWIRRSEYGKQSEYGWEIDHIKTCDYMKRLLGFDTVAVGRHIKAFIENASISCHDYYDIKEVVEFAADLMDCARRELDYSI